MSFCIVQTGKDLRKWQHILFIMFARPWGNRYVHTLLMSAIWYNSFGGKFDNVQQNYICIYLSINESMGLAILFLKIETEDMPPTMWKYTYAKFYYTIVFNCQVLEMT